VQQDAQADRGVPAVVAGARQLALEDGSWAAQPSQPLRSADNFSRLQELRASRGSGSSDVRQQQACALEYFNRLRSMTASLTATPMRPPQQRSRDASAAGPAAAPELLQALAGKVTDEPRAKRPRDAGAIGSGSNAAGFVVPPQATDVRVHVTLAPRKDAAPERRSCRVCRLEHGPEAFSSPSRKRGPVCRKCERQARMFGISASKLAELGAAGTLTLDACMPATSGEVPAVSTPAAQPAVVERAIADIRGASPAALSDAAGHALRSSGPGALPPGDSLACSHALCPQPAIAGGAMDAHAAGACGTAVHASGHGSAAAAASAPHFEQGAPCKAPCPPPDHHASRALPVSRLPRAALPVRIPRAACDFSRVVS